MGSRGTVGRKTPLESRVPSGVVSTTVIVPGGSARPGAGAGEETEEGAGAGRAMGGIGAAGALGRDVPYP